MWQQPTGIGPLPSGASAGSLQLFGVSLDGAEWSVSSNGTGNNPGTIDVNYNYPPYTTAGYSDVLAYWKGKGLTFLRIPIRWERLQPTLNGALNSTNVTALQTLFSAADALGGLKLIIDCHNYGNYYTNPLGSGSATSAGFADFWSRVATQFSGYTSFFGYDLMNEPQDGQGCTFASWKAAAQAAITAIRLVDATHYIFIEGWAWATAKNWVAQSDDLKTLTDSANKLVFQAHSYWDLNGDGGGAYSGPYSTAGPGGATATPNQGVDLVTSFVGWCQTNGFQGMIGEYGVPQGDSNWATVLDNFLAYLNTNHIWGTYWAAGNPFGQAWGGGNPPIIAAPQGNSAGTFVDSPQMTVLAAHPSH